MRFLPKLFVLLGFLLAAGDGWSQADQSAKNPAQPGEAAKYYRLDFVVKDTENGKPVSARNYSLIASTGTPGSNCSIRAGDKIPTPTGKEQFTFIDVGVSLDCHDLKEVEQKLALRIQADITGPAGQVAAASGAPLIRQFRWSSDVIVPLRKATVIYQSDGASAKGGMQVELTATPLQ